VIVEILFIYEVYLSQRAYSALRYRGLDIIDVRIGTFMSNHVINIIVNHV